MRAIFTIGVLMIGLLTGCDLTNYEKSPVATAYAANHKDAGAPVDAEKAALCWRDAKLTATVLFSDGVLREYVTQTEDDWTPVLRVIQTSAQRDADQDLRRYGCIGTQIPGRQI